MRKLLSICAGLAMMLSAATAMAADVTGTWTGAGDRPRRKQHADDVYLQAGRRHVDGHGAAAAKRPIAISNGKVDGDKFTFDDSFNGITIHHDCTVDGDSIKMSTKTDSGDFPGMELTLTRVKDTPAAPTTPAAPATPATPPPQ